MTQPPAAGVEADVVLLTVPADGAYLGVLRTAAAGLAARLHFTLDEIEDLRIAVDEACAMLIRLAAPMAMLRCRFALAGDELGVEVAVSAAPEASPPATSTFAWKVLTALATAPSVEFSERTATIALTARRSDLPGRRPLRYPTGSEDDE
ncbi:MAG: ATP-binding protein [Natronosporangium sp.]